jgi:hypothetical protein
LGGWVDEDGSVDGDENEYPFLQCTNWVGGEVVDSNVVKQGVLFNVCPAGLSCVPGYE